MRLVRSLPLLLAAIPLGAVLAAAAARADTVGTAGAVNTTSSGTPPGAPWDLEAPLGPWKTAIVFWGVGADAPGWLVQCLSDSLGLREVLPVPCV